MALSDVTHEAVLQAMDEYDRLGPDDFLSQHGYAPARLYRLTHNGRHYDSKAIVGVAHGYATGDELRAGDFSGGLQTVVKLLESRGFAIAPTSVEDTRAWLVTTKSDYRRLGGYTKYDDDPSSHYSYDSNVANSKQVGVGHRLVFWDEEVLIGASTIASIAQRQGTKRISRCPKCATTNIAARKTMSPRFRCDKCGDQFEVPVADNVEVTHFQTDHHQGWVDLAGLLDGAALRSITGYSQNSIRRIDWARFASAIDAVAGSRALTQVELAFGQVTGGGHELRQVRTRLGQPAFRADLIRRYGEVCAFSGPCPKQALEACHLYSYAEAGRHDEQGGLLLRRDLHALFDRGFLAVSPNNKIDVTQDLQGYELYRSLHGKTLHTRVSDRQSAWLQLHWAQWRAVP